jgi:hypothetical protein
MTVIYVDGKNGNDDAAGTAAAPLRCIGKAIETAVSGDTVRVRSGVYYERLTLNKAGLVVEADEGHKPELNGRWGPELFGKAGFVGYDGKQIGPDALPSPIPANAQKGNFVVAGGYANLIELSGKGSTLRGFVIRNVAGRGVLFSADDTAMESCTLDFFYAGAIVAGSGLSGVRIRDCRVTRASFCLYDPTRFGQTEWGGGPAMVATAVILKCNALVQRMHAAYCGGEGIVASRTGSGAIIEDCVVHTNNHFSLGVNSHPHATLRNNTVYWCEDVLPQFGRDNVPDLMTLADEGNAGDSTHTLVYGNLLVGGSRCINIGTGGRPFGLRDGYLGGNTGIARPGGHALFWPFNPGDPHTDSLVENNIFWRQLVADPFIKWTPGGNVTYRHNLGNGPLPFGGQGNVIVGIDSHVVMVNPWAMPKAPSYHFKQVDVPDPLDTTFERANYALKPGSPALGAASDGSPANGITPPIERANIGAAIELNGPEPEPDPDPEPQWWETLTDEEWRAFLSVAVGKLAAMATSN